MQSRNKIHFVLEISLSLSFITMRGWSDAHCQGTAFEHIHLGL